MHSEVVTESHKYWCPTWTNPFKVCTRRSQITRWCYKFAWHREVGFGFVNYHEGCEGGTLYTWWTPAFFSFGQTIDRFDGLSFQMCFTSVRKNAGRCAM